MKHSCLVVFSIIFVMTSTTTYSMDYALSRFSTNYVRYEKIHKKRTLRDELLVAHTIVSQHNIPQDIANLILQKSYQLKMRHSGMDTLNFTSLKEKALVDFLYFTNEQAFNFLKTCPRINVKVPCIELYSEDGSLDWRILPEGLSKYTVRLRKPYDD
jgi:hypothetical protein